MKRILLLPLLVISYTSSSWAINEAFAIGYAHDSEYVLSRPEVTTAPNIKRLENENLESKVKAASATLLGKPYAASPLGEGSGYDADPRIRYDKFDCTTFVETSLALGLSVLPTDNGMFMDHIRYHNGVVSFETRNHFTNVDWVKNNSWLLSEATEKYFPENAVELKTIIDKKTWFFKNFKLVVSQPVETSVLHYLSFADIEKNPEILEALPQVAMFNIVRRNWSVIDKIGTNLDISHQGFIMKTEKGIVARHASQRHQITMEQPIDVFVKEMQMASPTVVGIQILELNENVNLPNN